MAHRKSFGNDSGQVAVEYILLFALALILAMLITTQLVRRDPAEPGFLIGRWQSLKIWIGQDDPGKR